MTRLRWPPRSRAPCVLRDTSTPRRLRCPATYYVGSEDWIVPHVRADAEALDATVDVIAGQAHIGSFFSAAEQVLEVVASRLQR